MPSISSTATRPIRTTRSPASRRPGRAGRAGSCCATPTAAACRTRSPSTVERVARRIPPDQLGIHAHNDTENAVANTLAARARRRAPGAGHAERPGRALRQRQSDRPDPDADAQDGLRDRACRKRACAISPSCRAPLDERLNRIPDRHAAYVGACAFTHKAGLHASAVAKDPSSYEHVPPELVGNQRHVAVSDQAGPRQPADPPRRDRPARRRAKSSCAACSARSRSAKRNGYAYEGAEASFELLARRTLGQVPDFFRLSSFRIIDERRYNARNELVTLSEATIKVEVGDARRMIVAEGNGPVHALDTALRQALSPTYPALEHMHLADYKVRILTPEAGTAAVTRVIIESADDRRPALVDGRRLDQRDRRLLRRPARRASPTSCSWTAPPRRSEWPDSPPPQRRTRPLRSSSWSRPQLGENVGAAARAMLNFGLTDLRLVAAAMRLAERQGGAGGLGRDRGAQSAARVRAGRGRDRATCSGSTPPPRARASCPSPWSRRRRPRAKRVRRWAAASGSASCSAPSAPACPTTI